MNLHHTETRASRRPESSGTRRGDAEKLVPTMLIVDDDSQIVKLLRRQGEKSGFRVLTAGDGQAGLELALAESPEVILLDIGLPKLDGRDLLRQFREMKASPDSLVIFLSGRDTQSDRLLGLELGADDYETKPFLASHLMRRIVRMVEKRWGTRRSMSSLHPDLDAELDSAFARAQADSAS